MAAIVVHSGSCFGDTFSHVVPPSLVIWTVLTSMPTHSSPLRSPDSASACARHTQYSEDHWVERAPPGIFCSLSKRLRDRSGLIGCQEFPSSSVRKTRL